MPWPVGLAKGLGPLLPACLRPLSGSPLPRTAAPTLTRLQGLLLLQQGHLLRQALQLTLELLKHLRAHDI